VSSSSSNRLKM